MSEVAGNVSEVTKKCVFSHKFPEDSCDPSFKGFLNASDGVRNFLASLGPTLFSPVTSDIKGNIDKLNNFVENNPECLTLGQMLQKEKNLCGDSLKGKIASDALLWLTRALDFVLLFLTLWIQDQESGVKSDDLSNYFRTAYEMTLKSYHSWIVQKVVNVIMAATPSRTDILSCLTKNADQGLSEEEIFQDLTLHVKLLRSNIDSVRKLFDEVNYPWK